MKLIKRIIIAIIGVLFGYDSHSENRYKEEKDES